MLQLQRLLQYRRCRSSPFHALSARSCPSPSARPSFSSFVLPSLHRFFSRLIVNHLLAFLGSHCMQVRQIHRSLGTYQGTST